MGSVTIRDYLYEVGYAKVDEALRFDREGRIFLRPEAEVVKYRGLPLPKDTLEFSKLHGYLGPRDVVVSVTINALPKQPQLAGPSDVPVNRLLFEARGGHITRVKNGVLYSQLRYLSLDDKFEWWVSSKGFTIASNGVKSDLTLDSEVQTKQQLGFVQVRYHRTKHYDCVQVKMEPGRFKPWRLLYVSL